MSARVAALFIYPLKSAAAIAVTEMQFDEIGATNDRRWMLVDSQGTALTQRDAPALSRVTATPGQHAYTLLLHAPGMQPVLATVSSESTHVQVNIWGDVVDAMDAGDEAASWCATVAGIPCRLVRIDPHAVRPLAPKYAGPIESTNRHVAFPDGSPALLLSNASISALNARLIQAGELAVGVERFRPNILLEGVEPHAEDSWSDIQIGSMQFGVGSTCPRCVMTTVDQAMGKRTGAEPLRLLSTYRREDGGVMFGVNATHAVAGRLRVGDVVRINAMK